MIDVEMNIKTITETKKRYIPYDIYSNCVTEIPQNLKFEFSNGNVTLKAGSIITKSGATYQTQVTTSDVVWSSSTQTNTKLYLFISNYGNLIGLYNNVTIGKVGSGSSLPADGSAYSTFFNTTDKTVYQWSAGVWSATSWAYPLGIVEVDGNGNITGFAKDSNNRDMIFNGAGFVGHHAFVYPNVKGLFANGKDTGGNLSSIQYTNSSLLIVELTTASKNVEAFNNNTVVPRYDIGEFDNEDDLPTDISNTYYTAYIKSENARYYKNTNNAWSLQLGHYLNLVEYTYDGTTVTDFTIRQPYEDPANQTLYYEEEYEEEREVADFKAIDTVVFKAKNILEIQEGSLTYQPELGIDLKRFLDPDVKIQNETFEAYTIQRLGEQGVNPIELLVNKDEIFKQIFNYKVVEASTEGMIAK